MPTLINNVKLLKDNIFQKLNLSSMISISKIYLQIWRFSLFLWKSFSLRWYCWRCCFFEGWADVGPAIPHSFSLEALSYNLHWHRRNWENWIDFNQCLKFSYVLTEKLFLWLYDMWFVNWWLYSQFFFILLLELLVSLIRICQKIMNYKSNYFYFSKEIIFSKRRRKTFIHQVTFFMFSSKKATWHITPWIECIW